MKLQRHCIPVVAEKTANGSFRTDTKGALDNSRIIHNGSGKLEVGQDLRVFTTKWLGDDMRVNFRDHGIDPNHSSITTQYGLKPGDRPGTDLYPKICP